MQHLACIMDGNRRYAKKQGWQVWRGHQQGVEAVRVAMDFCLEQQIPYLSLYTFSIENFKRPPKEQAYLFKLLVQKAREHLDELKNKGIRVRFIGDKSLFPESVLPTCTFVEEQTRQNSTLQVNFLFCYGGQQEILHGVKQVVHAIQTGALTCEQLTEQRFARYLWTEEMPAPDLILRTGGVKRLSNFFLYQAAYSEFYFSDCLWPEITAAELHKAVGSFGAVKRNFGV